MDPGVDPRVDAVSDPTSEASASGVRPVEGEADQPGVRRSRLVPILAGLLVAALAAAALLGWQNISLREDRALADAAAEATEVAERVVTEMTTYDHTTVEEDFAWVTEVGTARFEKDQEATAAPLIPIIKRTKAQAEGTVQRSAATAVSEDEVTVLLFVDQVLGREGTEQTNVDRTRVEMTMVREAGTWLVDEIQLY